MKSLVLTLLLAVNCCAGEIKVFFSPDGGCTQAITNEVAHAKRSVLVQAYSFTSAPIAKAVVDAHRRGVKVAVILDKSQRTEKYSSADFLKNNGVPTYTDSKHPIAHNKVMVIDGETVITGSFNFTKAAEEANAENLLIIRDAALAARYTTNWQHHAAHATRYLERKKSSARGVSDQPGNAPERLADVSESASNPLEPFGKVPESLSENPHGPRRAAFGVPPSGGFVALPPGGGIPNLGFYSTGTESFGAAPESFADVSELFGAIAGAFDDVPERFAKAPEPESRR